jgi:hypothetical protein
MRSVYLAALALSLASMAGCAPTEHDLVLAPVGPPPLTQAPAASTGSLLVFTAFDAFPHFNSQPEDLFYSDYQLCSADGKLLRKVRNNPSPSVPGPVGVDLPPGEYRVVAHANGYGRVAVPVVIRPHQVTTVHLEGGTSPAKQPPAGEASLVRLPDGQVVGWCATPAKPAPAPVAYGALAHQSDGKAP